MNLSKEAKKLGRELNCSATDKIESCLKVVYAAGGADGITVVKTNESPAVFKEATEEAFAKGVEEGKELAVKELTQEFDEKLAVKYKEGYEAGQSISILTDDVNNDSVGDKSDSASATVG